MKKQPTPQQPSEDSKILKRKIIEEDKNGGEIPNQNGSEKNPEIQAKVPYLGKYDDAPTYMRDSQHYIKKGYRINYNQQRFLFKSFFQWHNESVNIWTHFFGAVLVIGLVIYSYISIQKTNIEEVQNYISSVTISKLEPLYGEISNITHLDIGEKIHDLNENFKLKFHSLMDEVNKIDQFIHLDQVQKKFFQVITEIQNSLHVFDSEMITEMKQQLNSKIDQMQESFVNRFDSQDYNWMELDFSNFFTDQDTKIHQQLPHLTLHRWPIFIFLISATACLLFSSIFHLVYCYSHTANQIFLRLDYAGVSLLISGTTFPPYYYGLYCYPNHMIFYMVLLSTSCLIVFFISLQDFIHTPKYLQIKSFMYGSLGCFAGVPLFHLAYIELAAWNKDQYTSIESLPYYMMMGFCYLGGLAIYTFKCPQRYQPGKYDQCGASHQLWHVSILLAILFSYVGAILNYQTRKRNMVCPG